MKRIFLLSLLPVIGLFSNVFFAQNVLNINNKASQKTTFELSSVQKVVFIAGNVIVINKDTSTKTFLQSEIAYFDFKNASTGFNPNYSLVEGSIYPNPVVDEFRIKYINSTDSKTLNVQIIGLDGKVLLSKKLKSVSDPITISTLSSGIYFCRFTDGTLTQTIKIIKQ